MISFVFRHGDILYIWSETRNTGGVEVSGKSSPLFSTSTSSNATSAATAPQQARPQPFTVIEDQVDQLLEKQDGRIIREKNEQL